VSKLAILLRNLPRSRGSRQVAAEDVFSQTKTFNFESFAESGETAKTEENQKQDNFNFLDDFRSELGLEESEPAEAGDYETHYHLAIAYKEMGLMEESIREFQDAINLVRADDGTRRFFQCCNLLGHCFMEQGNAESGSAVVSPRVRNAEFNGRRTPSFAV
jgi:tetratricopeptide (TPR) repeat protein